MRVHYGISTVLLLTYSHEAFWDTQKVSFDMFQTEKVAEKEAILQHKKEFMVARQQDDVKKMMHRQVKHSVGTQFPHDLCMHFMNTG